MRHLKEKAVFLLAFTLKSGSKYIFFILTGCRQRGGRSRTFMSRIATRASSLINYFIYVHFHINKESFLFMKTETCINYNKNVVCKVFHRLALTIKMEHPLNMCTFFPFIYSNIVEVRPIKLLILIRKAFFLVDSLKNIHAYFSNMNYNDIYKKNM